jgi:hypothetical protein
MKDPQVNYLSIRSFATGLTGLAQLAFDVLKNTIMLPKDLISPESTDNGKAPPSTVPELPAERVPEPLGAPRGEETSPSGPPPASGDRAAPETPPPSP